MISMVLHMKQLAQFVKVIGDSNRLAIIKAISNKACSVTEIINATGLSQTLVSFHLRNLRDSGVVKTRREGPFIYYSLSDINLLDILDQLAVMAGLRDNLFSVNHSVKSLKIHTQRR
ncbi:MAG TPA: transcriptional regulator [Desulfobacterales bacterium]|nr:transcriptional regulator [Desulfobacterales bacterium]